MRFDLDQFSESSRRNIVELGSFKCSFAIPPARNIAWDFLIFFLGAKAANAAATYDTVRKGKHLMPSSLCRACHWAAEVQNKCTGTTASKNARGVWGKNLLKSNILWSGTAGCWSLLLNWKCQAKRYDLAYRFFLRDKINSKDFFF